MFKANTIDTNTDTFVRIESVERWIRIVVESSAKLYCSISILYSSTNS